MAQPYQLTPIQTDSRALLSAGNALALPSPGIIMQGQGPDVMNALAGGLQTGVAMRDARYQGEHRNALAMHGPNALAGDQEARGALAAFDPQGMQQMGAVDQSMQLAQRQDARGEEQLQLAREAGAREAQRFVADMDAEEAAEAVAQYRRGLEPFLLVRNQQELDAALVNAGAQPGSITMDTLEMRLAEEYGAVGVLEVRAMQRPAAAELPSSVQALMWRAEQAGLKQGTPEYQAFMASGGDANGMSLSVNPDGTVNFATGAGASQTAGGNIPERQSQIQLFGSMMSMTDPVLNAFEETYNPANASDAAARAVPVVGNYLQSNEGQQYQVAAMAWAEGALRLATGAAATAPEVQRVFTTYFAQPGDSAQTVALKRQLRAGYQQSLVAASGGGFTPGANQLPPDPLAYAASQGAGGAAPAGGNFTLSQEDNDLIRMYGGQ